MGPAPRTANRSGHSVIRKTVSFVRNPASASPGISGLVARAPEAITARSKLSLWPSTSIDAGPLKRPWPMKTSMPRPCSRETESLGLIFALSRRMRSIAAAKSTSTSPRNRTPKFKASPTSYAARPARITPLEGTQPTFRQSPPIRARSMIATFAPSPAEPTALTSPAVPAPITTRLYFPDGVGFVHSAGWTLSRRTWSCESPSSTMRR